MLGEKITATITAKYYFGSPVTKAKVKYKVLRTPLRTKHGIRQARGTGSTARLLVVRLRLRLVSRLAPLGLRAPYPWWFWRAPAPPEIVAEQESRSVPTARSRSRSTRRRQGDPSRPGPQYEITAEVIDASRRTIVGTGKVLVARKPFRQCFGLGRRGTTARAIRLLPAAAAQRSTASRSRARASCGCCRSATKTRSRSKPRRGSGTSTPSETGQAELPIKASRSGPVPAVLQTDRRRRAQRSRAATSSPSSAKAFDGSRLPLQRPRDSCPTSANTTGAKSRVAASTPTASARPCCCSCGRPTASTCRRRCSGLEGKSTWSKSTSSQKTCPTSSSRRSPSPADGAHRGPRDRRAAGEARAQRRGAARRPRNTCPGKRRRSQLKLTDVAGKPFVGSTRARHLRQGGRVHLRRVERGGDQGVLLEMAAAAISPQTETSLQEYELHGHQA